MQPPGNTAPTRWVILHTPLGPCIHDSVVIGSLSDLRSQQNWDASSVTSMAIKICMDTHYPIYILQVECEAFEYLWNWSWYDYVPWIPDCTKHCNPFLRSSRRLRIPLYGWSRTWGSARLLMLMFVLPLFRVIVEPLSMAATLIWFIGVSFVEPREALPLWVCASGNKWWVLGVY